ncbi:MAG: DUF4433 domain-containing protein [Chloroflexi bacterium]|nr:DUF4433 domain-containing protein [Chloroflexota bacterium]MBU1661381.1 DUF4433 domain-containing protein [Chloroflexota bacterium]
MFPVPTPIYHITHARNLPSIIENGGLLACNQLDQLGAKYESIAYQNIQDRRASTPVPLPPGGNLHDYIPFYFAPRSPMLYSINRGNVAGIENQRPIIHLVTHAQSVQEAGFEFVFTDGHGIMVFTEFFNQLDELNRVDWEIMEVRYWYDTIEDNDRKRRRQAEFLVYRFCPWELIVEIGVIHAKARDWVCRQLENQPHQPPVTVQRRWYY